MRPAREAPRPPGAVGEEDVARAPGGSPPADAGAAATPGPRDAARGPGTQRPEADRPAEPDAPDELFRESEEDLGAQVAEGLRDLRALSETVLADRPSAGTFLGGRLSRAQTAHVLLWAGLALAAAGVAGVLAARAAETAVFFSAGVGAAAVACTAAGVLLLPEPPADP